MSKRKVVVTGLGIVSPVGIGIQQAWDNLLRGTSGVGPITKFDASALPTRIAAEVKGFNAADWMPLKETRRSDTFIHYGLAATRMALDDAGFSIDEAAGGDVQRGAVGQRNGHRFGAPHAEGQLAGDHSGPVLCTPLVVGDQHGPEVGLDAAQRLFPQPGVAGPALGSEAVGLLLCDVGQPSLMLLGPRLPVAGDDDVGDGEDACALGLQDRLVRSERIDLGRPVLAPPEMGQGVHPVVRLDEE